jgi:hypothetical protein
MRRGRGLIGTVATTAVIAGTATATSNAITNRQMHKQQAAMAEQAEQQNVADLQQQMADLQAQQVQAQVAPAAAPAAPPANDLVAQLAQLGQLQQSGVLSQAEFDAAKAKLLGG